MWSSFESSHESQANILISIMLCFKELYWLDLLDSFNQKHFRPLASLCLSKALLDAVEEVLGPNIVLLGTTLFVKYPAQVLQIK